MTAPIVIVGAGPAGMLLACLLAHRGLPVRVVEQRDAPSERPRAFGLPPAALAALDAVGLEEGVRGHAVALTGGRFVVEGSEVASVPFGDDPPVVLEQHRLETLLAARLHALDPQAIRRSMRVAALDLDGDSARLRVETTRDRSPRFMDAPLVVLADGARSRLRATLGVRFDPVGPGRAYAMAESHADDGDVAEVVIHGARDGVVESFPLPGGRRRWVAATSDARALSDEQFAALIAARTGHRPAWVASTVSRFTAQNRRASRLVRGCALLLGDCAHEISPIGGQGISVGAVAALHLADLIARSGPGRPLDGRRYERTARASARAAQRRSRVYMALGSPPHAVIGARDRLVRVLGDAVPAAVARGLLVMPRDRGRGRSAGAEGALRRAPQ